MAAKLASPVEVERYLANIDYPCDKEDLLTHAREQGATADVLDTLEQLPDGTYRSSADISRGIGNLT